MTHGSPVVVTIDKRDLRGGEKNWEWVKKGIPLRLEVGPRDLEKRCAMLCRRDRGVRDKESVGEDVLADTVVSLLDDMQDGYFQRAAAFRDANIRRDIEDFDSFKAFFTPKNASKPEIHGGFVFAKWCGDSETERLLDDLKVTIRCLPLQQSGTEGRCVLTGRPATIDAVFAKAY